MASMSSFESATSSTGDLDELPDYNAFLKHQGTERIKPFLHDDREVFQTLREIEGSGFGDKGEKTIVGVRRRWR